MFEQYLFRAIAYIMFGIVMEVMFSVVGIEVLLGQTIPNRRLPKRYLEGFVSLFMIPLYLWIGFMIMEPELEFIPLPIIIRFLAWSVCLTMWEALYGFMLDAFLGDYPWSYYALSKYKIFKRGYTLWTLVPVWGLVGLIAEWYVSLVLYLSPYVERFVNS